MTWRGELKQLAFFLENGPSNTLKLIKRHFLETLGAPAKPSRGLQLALAAEINQTRAVVIIVSLCAYGVAEETEPGVSRSLSWPQAAEMSLPRDSRTSAV